ncbi:hypothetical protein PORY_002538 [Pneumocystis oryctolagi]|uniref:Uncharacterized protein n=1 Tax=Pneumocystis oryctolagi TaxID=42067 RepID=A0ACB7CAG7_9ASCO|nr:hypothetical protein PORY_002538 [Pneumocystis oryctolagi]
MDLHLEKVNDMQTTQNEYKKKNQKTEDLSLKNISNTEEKCEKMSVDEYEISKDSPQASDSSKHLFPLQKTASSSNTSLPDKSPQEAGNTSNKNASSMPFHRLMMSIQSMVGQDSVSWNNNSGSPNKNYSTETTNVKTENWNSVSSLAYRRPNDVFRPNIEMNPPRPINHPPFNNILIHDNDIDQEKQNFNRYPHFHLFDKVSPLPPPLFPNNMMMPSTLPSLSQGHQPLNQSMDRGKQYDINHVDENYSSPASRVMFPNKFNATSPNVQKNLHYYPGSGGKPMCFYPNEQLNSECCDSMYKQSLPVKSKSQETNRYPHKTNTVDESFKASQETPPQKKSQKEVQKQPPRPTVPLPRPKLIVKNDAVMSFVEGIEEKDLGEHIYTPFNPVPRVDGKLNGILTVRIAKQYFYKSENDGIKRRALWGTDIYTDDSDIVAILLHTGRLKKKRPSSDAIVKVRVLPRLIKYSGSLRHNIMSRGWKTRHDGESIMIEDFKWVEDKTRKGRKDMKERIAARYRLQLSL